MVTPKRLRRMAGERYFARGEAYFAASAVRSLRAYEGGAKVVVQGTHVHVPYQKTATLTPPREVQLYPQPAIPLV